MKVFSCSNTNCFTLINTTMRQLPVIKHSRTSDVDKLLSVWSLEELHRVWTHLEVWTRPPVAVVM